MFVSNIIMSMVINLLIVVDILKLYYVMTMIDYRKEWYTNFVPKLN